MYLVLLRLTWCLLLAAACTLALQRQAWAQQPVPEHDLKTAYILNFIQFVEWPADSPGSAKDWSLCVSAFSPLLRALNGLQGKELPNGHNLRIRLFDPGNAQECRVLVLQGADMERVNYQPLQGRRGVLTLSDDPVALRTGIMIGMSEQGGRIVFDIDQTAAIKAGLVISSRLLRLARTVR